MRKKGEKMFVVRKYVMATTAEEAIHKEPKVKVSDVWIDDEWKKGQAVQLEGAIGFNTEE